VCFPGFAWHKSIFILTFLALVLSGLTLPAQTNLAVQVRNAPSLNGGARIEGSLQQMLPENVTLNGGVVLTGDYYLPGRPVVTTNGPVVMSGVLPGTGQRLSHHPPDHA